MPRSAAAWSAAWSHPPMAPTFPETSFAPHLSVDACPGGKVRLCGLNPRSFALNAGWGAKPWESRPFEPALFRAKCLRIRLVKGLVLDKQSSGARPVAVRPDFRCARSARKASGLNFMSTKRMTPAHQGFLNRWSLEGLARLLRVVAGLAVAGMVLSACSSATEIWDKVTQKDDTFVDEPAEKLYNEGLFLTEREARSEGRREEIRGSGPPASLFGSRAQVAADVGLRLLPGQRL